MGSSLLEGVGWLGNSAGRRENIAGTGQDRDSPAKNSYEGGKLQLYLEEGEGKKEEKKKKRKEEECVRVSDGPWARLHVRL